MNNDNGLDNEKPSGVYDNEPKKLVHTKQNIQPLHDDVEPEEVDVVDATKEPISLNTSENSILDNLVENKNSLPLQKRETPAASAYQYVAPELKVKRLYGLYALSFFFVYNAIKVFFLGNEFTGDELNFFRLLSAVGLLIGIGLLMRKEYARILSIAFFLLWAISGLGLIKLVALFAIIYLNLPHVKNEF